MKTSLIQISSLALLLFSLSAQAGDGLPEYDSSGNWMYGDAPARGGPGIDPAPNAAAPGLVTTTTEEPNALPPPPVIAPAPAKEEPIVEAEDNSLPESGDAAASPLCDISDSQWEAKNAEVKKGFPQFNAESADSLAICDVEKIPEESKKAYMDYIDSSKRVYCNHREDAYELYKKTVALRATASSKLSCEDLKSASEKIKGARSALEKLRADLDASTQKTDSVFQKTLTRQMETMNACQPKIEKTRDCRALETELMEVRKRESYTPKDIKDIRDNENNACNKSRKHLEALRSDIKNFWDEGSAIRASVQPFKLELITLEAKIGELSRMEKSYAKRTSLSCAPKVVTPAPVAPTAPAAAAAPTTPSASANPPAPSGLNAEAQTAPPALTPAPAPARIIPPNVASGTKPDLNAGSQEDSIRPIAGQSPSQSTPKVIPPSRLRYPIKTGSEMAKCYEGQCSQADIKEQQKRINNYIKVNNLPLSPIAEDGVPGVQTANAWRAVALEITRNRAAERGDTSIRPAPKTSPADYIVLKKGKVTGAEFRRLIAAPAPEAAETSQDDDQTDD